MIVKVGLSHESIQRAIKELEGYADGLESKCQTFCDRLAEIGVKTAVNVVQSSTNGTGELASGIHVEPREAGGCLVVASGDHVAFVEFGTGVVGSGTYAGELPQGWGYDQRRTPEAHDAADPTRWWYYDKEGRRRSTRGQRALGYMDTAAQTMRNDVLEIAREVFGS